MPIVASLARATLLEAVRNRLLWLAVMVVVIAFGLAQFLNQVAITESREIQTALLAAPLRIAAVFIVAVFVITSMVRESSDKVTELLLSLPAPRSHYFFGKFLGYAAVGAILALLCALPLVPFAQPLGLALWTASLVCELLIVAAMSLFCVLSLAQVVPTFAAVGGFYLLSRSRSEEHTSELQSLRHLVCRLLLEKKKPTRQAHGRRLNPGLAAPPSQCGH